MKKPVRQNDGKYHVSGKTYKVLIGSRSQVYNKTAYKTPGGLTKSHLIMNKWGRIVSAAKHRTAKKEKRLERAGFFAKKGKFGFVRKMTRKMSRKNKKYGGEDDDNGNVNKEILVDNEEKRDGNDEEERRGGNEEEERRGGNEEEERRGGNDEEEKRGGNDDEERRGGNDEEEKRGGNEEEEKRGGNEEEEKRGGNDEEERRGGNDEEERRGGNDEEEKRGGKRRKKKSVKRCRK